MSRQCPRRVYLKWLGMSEVMRAPCVGLILNTHLPRYHRCVSYDIDVTLHDVCACTGDNEACMALVRGSQFAVVHHRRRPLFGLNSAALAAHRTPIFTGQNAIAKFGGEASQ